MNHRTWNQNTRVGFLLLHGWTDARDFPEACQMQRFASVCYPQAPRRWWNFLLPPRWTRQHVPALADLAEAYFQEFDLQYLAIGGHSQGCEVLHYLAAELVERGRAPLGLVHYSGRLRGQPVVRSIERVIVAIGCDDPIRKMRLATEATAAAYGVQVTEFVGRHRWPASASMALALHFESIIGRGDEV